MLDLLNEYFKVFVNILTEDWSSPNSTIKPLILPMMSAGFGALSGGWFAYKLRLKENRQQKQLDRLKRLQLAALTAASIGNTALGLKKQFVKGMFDAHLEQRRRILSVLGTPTIKKVIEVKFDLMTLVCPRFHMDGLVEDIRAVTGKDGKHLLQLSVLIESVENLASVIEQRNQWIRDFEASKGQRSDQEGVLRYLGIPLDADTRDERYLHLIEQLYHTTDCVIFYSLHIYYRLTLELVHESDVFQRRYREQFNFQIMDFREKTDEEFFPDPAEFRAWTEETKPIRKPRFWGRRSWTKQILNRLESGTGQMFTTK